MSEKNEIVLFVDDNMKLEVPVSPEQDTVWLSLDQMAELFEKDRSVIGRHVRNIFKEGELDEDTSGQIMPESVGRSHRPIKVYNLDVIISVGYRVKSKRGVAFRKWANIVLRDYIIKGYAINSNRIAQLDEVIRIIKHAQNDLDTTQVLSVVERYTHALNLLDAYDHQTMIRPKGNKAIYVLNYEECRALIDNMRFADTSELFGNEKDASFKGSIGTIYQSFAGEDLYPSLEEKAANLLYFITKDHSFSDGNKRIAATVFLYFLDKNESLVIDGEKIIDDYTLVALTIMIAESQPKEKEMMISIIMNCLSRQ